MLCFDGSIRIIYACNPEQWTKLGEPCGFFWVPPKARNHIISSGLVRSDLYNRLSKGKIQNIALDIKAVQMEAKLRVTAHLARVFYSIAALDLAIAIIVFGIKTY